MPSGDVDNPQSEAPATRAGGKVLQSELDAMIAAFEANERSARQAATPVAAPVPLDSPARDSVETVPVTAPSARGGGKVTQSELDALIAAIEDKEHRARPTSVPSGPAAPLEPPPQEAAEASASDMDALIRQAAPPEVALSAAQEEPDPPRTVAQFPEAVNEGPAPGADESVRDALDLPQALDVDDVLAGDASDSSLVGVPGELVAGEGEAPEDAIASAEVEGTESADVEPDEMDEILAAVPAPAPPSVAPAPQADAVPARVLDSVTQTTIIEEIGSENIAAGAAAELAPAGQAATSTPAAAPSPAAVTSAAKQELSTAAEVPPSTSEAPSPRRSWLPPSLLSLAREQPARTLAAAGLGLFTAVLTFAYLYGNQLRPADPVAGDPRAQMPLERALRTAEALMEEKDYVAAASLLGAALVRAEGEGKGEGEDVVNAKFLHVQAMFLAAPAQLTDTEANPLHEAIDDAIAVGHEHPKTSEALMWKAEVYEREGNVAAARAELRGILENYGSAPNRDAVLLALAELELRTQRRAEAITAAERLLSEFPSSPLTGRARLVQGDAFALGGNAKAARAAFLLAATEGSAADAGTTAFERLAGLALDAGQPEAAIEELLKRLDTATTVKGNDVVYLALARAYRAAKQPEKARNVLNELIDFFPESKVMPAALVELSLVLDDLGLHAEAGRLADRAAEHYPTNPDVLRRAGQMLADRGEPAGAGKKLIAAYDAGAHEPGVLLAAAGYLLEGGDAKEAQKVYERLMEEHGAAPEALDAKIGWAHAAHQQGDLENAFVRLQELSGATEGGPRQLIVLRALADLYRELGLEGELIETYGKVATVTNEAGPLAEAAEGLFEAGAEDEGLQIAGRVEVSHLEPTRAYGFLMAWGKTLLRKDADEALKVLMHAHEQYPAERSAEGVETVLRAVLTLGRSAQARALVADLQSRVALPDHAAERPWFERAAVQYADFLFRRGDYTQAAEVYAMVTPPAAAKEGPPAESASVEPTKVEETEAQRWSFYQRANALYAVGNLAECLPLYDAVGGSGSRYAGDAKARAELVRFEFRRRGQPDPTAIAQAAS